MLGFREIDRILRGEHRRDVRAVRVGPLLFSGLLLAAVYGVCMGFFGLFARGDNWEYRQVIACMFKVPTLLGLSILVTFPSLYVFNTLLGSRLTFGDLVRLLTATLGILVAVLAGFGPIVAFFSVTTINYPFAVIMNVASFGLAALIAIGQLYRTLSAVLDSPKVAVPVESETEASSEPPPRISDEKLLATKALFGFWTILFAMVGTQMSWVLRPFIGSPTMDFTWFRSREGSFIEAVMKSIRMLSGS